MAELLTPDQVAERLQVNTETVYRYIKARKLRAVRIGRRYRIEPEDLNAFLQESKTGGND